MTGKCSRDSSTKLQAPFSEYRDLRWALTFKRGHGLQDAKLLENCHEKNNDHTDGKQLHALDPHDCRTGGAHSGPSLQEKAFCRRRDDLKPGSVFSTVVSQDVIGISPVGV